MTNQLLFHLRSCFAFGTWGQRARTVAFSLILTLIGFWAYGVLAVHFYRPQPMITLSGKTQTQCVGRYLIDVPVELGRLGSNDVDLLYGLDTDFDKVEMEVKDPDYTRPRFETEVQARLDDIKGERTDWGAPTLLAQEIINTRYGRALMLRFLNRGTVNARIQNELHMLVGSRYTLLKSDSYDTPDPEPIATKEKPMYTYIDPKPAEDRLRNVAMNIQGYTDATKAPEGFCVAGVVLNHKTMGYDIETAFFHSSAHKEFLPKTNLAIGMKGQYANNNEDNVFDRVARANPILRADLATGGGQLVQLRHGTPKINGMPAREYAAAMHIAGKVVFHLMAETALPKDQQSLQRPAFIFDFEAGSSMEEKTSPLDENQVLAIWDTLLTTMRLSPANGGNRIDGKTGALVPQTRVGEVCPRSGVWAASLPDTHPAARNLAIYHGRFKNVRAGDPMPTMFARFMFPQTADADNADITWSWVNQGSSA